MKGIEVIRIIEHIIIGIIMTVSSITIKTTINIRMTIEGVIGIIMIEGVIDMIMIEGVIDIIMITIEVIDIIMI